MTRTDDILSRLRVAANGVLLVAPCVECTFYFRYAPMPVIRDFADRALAALDMQLTRYLTGNMKRFAPRGRKSDDAYQMLFDRPRPGALYWMVLRGEGEGTSAAEIEVTLFPPPPLPVSEADVAAMIADNRDRFEIKRHIFTPHVSTVRATFPLDHPLAQPDALVDWAAGLAAVRTPAYVSGHAGYALNVDRSLTARDQQMLMQSTLAAALARHPGLGFENGGSITRKLLRYWPDHADFLPRFKRVQWLTFVRRQMLDELCGGTASVDARLRAVPDVQVADLGDGCMIRAGAAPGIGDVTQGDFLPVYRAVAQILAPARLPQFQGIGQPFTDEAAQAWLTAFERDHD